MICNSCGAVNNEDAKFCKNCGSKLVQGEPQKPQQTQPMPNQNIQYVNPERLPKVENYLVFSILVTLFCCLPLGIAAIVKSSQVDKELAMGNYEGALAASKQVKTLNLIGVIVTVVAAIIWSVVMFILPFIITI